VRGATGEAVEEAPFVDLVADFAWDGEDVGHCGRGILGVAIVVVVVVAVVVMVIIMTVMMIVDR
jgi:hypothetical protein